MFINTPHQANATQQNQTRDTGNHSGSGANNTPPAFNLGGLGNGNSNLMLLLIQLIVQLLQQLQGSNNTSSNSVSNTNDPAPAPSNHTPADNTDQSLQQNEATNNNSAATANNTSSATNTHDANGTTTTANNVASTAPAATPATNDANTGSDTNTDDTNGTASTVPTANTNKVPDTAVTSTTTNENKPVDTAVTQATNNNTQPEPTTSPTQNPTDPNQKVIDIYLLGGQSNAKALGAERLEKALENELGTDTTKHETRVFSYAVGGTSLHRDWKADGTDNAGQDGARYKAFQSNLDLYLNQVKRANPDAQVNIKGMFWHQGEKDSKDEATAQNYDENLTRFIQDVRTTTGVENLPFMIGRLSDSQAVRRLPHLATVQQNQDAVAAADPNAVSVNMDSISDRTNVHFSQDGYNKMADLFAKAYNGTFG